MNDAPRQSQCLDVIFETMRESILLLDGELRVRKANQSFYKLFNAKSRATEGCCIYDLVEGKWDIPTLRRLLGEVIAGNALLRDYKVPRPSPVLAREL